ncbi:hypothetical protein Tco_0081964, partial [Tanacetum coccineum]
SANVPAIYLQQFWKTMSYNEKTGVYSCQVDEQWFDLSADLLRKALTITPVIPAQPFELPPSVLDRKDFWHTQGQAGSDPEKVHEALSGPDPEPMQEDQTGSNSDKLHVSLAALAGPNPEHVHDKFLATAYPKVHENLKLIIDERVIE